MLETCTRLRVPVEFSIFESGLLAYLDILGDFPLPWAVALPGDGWPPPARLPPHCVSTGGYQTNSRFST